MGKLARRRRKVLTAAALISASTFGLLLLTAYPGKNVDRALDSLDLIPGRTRNLTREPDLQVDPALSPTGDILAYAGGVAGKMRIYTLPIDRSQQPALLTGDVEGDHRQPRWSPSGDRLAFVARGSIYQVAAGGGIPVLLQGPVNSAPAHSPAWSPDGRQLAFASGNSIWIRKADDAGGPVRVTDSEQPHSLAWAPDGSLLAFVSGNPFFNEGIEFGNIAPSNLWVVNTDGSEARRIAGGPHFSASPAWLPDGRGLLFVSDRDGTRDVYELSLSGAVRRLTTGLEAHSISLSPDARSLAYSVYRSRSNLFSIAIPSQGPVSVQGAEEMTRAAQSIEGISVSPDGLWLAYDSDLEGNQDIYLRPLRQGKARRLTDDPADDFLPAWSPDGKTIAFHSFRSGNRDIFVIGADGGPARQVTDDPSSEHGPDWSPDGRRLVFYGNRTGRYELYETVISAAGWTPPRQLTFDGGTEPKWSPDGRWIVYTRKSDRRLRLVSADGGADRTLWRDPNPDSAWRPEYNQWSPDGRKVHFKAYDSTGRPALWSIPAEGGTAALLVDFDDPRLFSPRDEFATDGRRFYFTLTQAESDVWLLELRRQSPK